MISVPQISQEEFDVVMSTLATKGYFMSEADDLRSSISLPTRAVAHRMARNLKLPFKFEIPQDPQMRTLRGLAEQDQVLAPWTVITIHEPRSDARQVFTWDHFLLLCFSNNNDAIYAKMFT